jgi:hypothetical protein
LAPKFFTLTLAVPMTVFCAVVHQFVVANEGEVIPIKHAATTQAVDALRSFDLIIVKIFILNPNSKFI